MPQVKIILENDSWDGEETHHYIAGSITDWEDVSDEDYQYMMQHRFDLHKFISKEFYERYQHVVRIRILSKDDYPIAERISNLKQHIELEREKERKLREQKEIERQAKIKAKELSQKERSLEQKRKKLEQLKKELGEV